MSQTLTDRPEVAAARLMLERMGISPVAPVLLDVGHLQQAGLAAGTLGEVEHDVVAAVVR